MALLSLYRTSRCQSTSPTNCQFLSLSLSLSPTRPLPPPPRHLRRLLQPSRATVDLYSSKSGTYSLSIYLIMQTSNGYLARKQYSSFASSRREVTYSCGTCAYDLNLSSSRRNTSTIGSKYSKSIKKGIITFFSIDQNRFNQVEESGCVPYLISKHSWGLFQRKTKLLCPICGNHIGNAYDDNSYPYSLIPNGLTSPSGSEISKPRKYDIRIRSLQPSSAEFGTPLVS